MRRIVRVVLCVVGLLWAAQIPQVAQARAETGSATAPAGADAAAGATASSQAAATSLWADFNGDGSSDLAVGVPLEDVSSPNAGEGAVSVIYGSPAGLSATTVPDQFWTQDSPDMDSSAETGDRFGDVLAAGDFNADGYADLAIGIPDEDAAAGLTNDGAVQVIYGSASGLSASIIPDQFWTQNSAGVNDTNEDYDHFGLALAAGNFNGDTYTDLAIAAPTEDTAAGVTTAGAVHVLHGSAGGLSATTIPDQVWTQDSASVEDTAEADDWFGRTLAAGDFNNDTFADLAVGMPYEETAAGVGNHGAVQILYGSSGGLSPTTIPDQLWTQNSAGVEGSAEDFDDFGRTLTVGDFNGDSNADLAVGAPLEDAAAGRTDDGGVHILYGSSGGLSATTIPDQLWGQDSPNVEDTAEDYDCFGSSTAAGDFNGDGRSDLAVGIGGEDLAAGVDGDGAVHVLYGSPLGLTTLVPDQLWGQDSPDMQGTPEDWDSFGAAVTAGDFDGDGKADLAAGVPGEGFATGLLGDGAVQVVYGSYGGLSATALTGDQLWGQDVTGVDDTAEDSDWFGYSLAASG